MAASRTCQQEGRTAAMTEAVRRWIVTAAPLTKHVALKLYTDQEETSTCVMFRARAAGNQFLTRWHHL